MGTLNSSVQKKYYFTSYNLVGIDVLVDAHHNVWLTEDFAQA
jgi:hypothetical protein